MKPTLLLARAAAVLMLLALLTGAIAGLALGGSMGGDGHTLLSAHLAALMGCFFCVAVGWTLRFIRYGETWQTRLAWLVVIGNAANWAITTVKAFLKVEGIALTGGGANDAVFVLLNVFVVLPTLAAAVIWVVGLWGVRTDS